MTPKKRIGFIGFGNMGQAICRGILDCAVASPSSVCVFDKVRAKAGSFAKATGVRVGRSAEEVVKRSEVLVLAVKPQDLAGISGVLAGLRPAQLLLSILAGTTLAALKKQTGGHNRIVRAMPNLGAQVGKGVTVLTGDRRSLTVARMIFAGCGATTVLPEKYFDTVTAISGSGPAYFFLLMELLTQVGREAGIPAKDAEMLAKRTALGASVLAARSDEAPSVLRERVTSKKGTTEAALRHLKGRAFGAIFKQAVRQAARRSRQMSRTKKG
ncbi:MAG: pyrroline-5-carboxylate reductase [Candidatus Omnitrophota bacterium]